MPVPPRRFPLLRRLALSLGLLLALAALGEVALRWAFGDQEDWEFRFHTVTSAVRSDAGRYRLHPDRFYEPAPQHEHGPHHAGVYATSAWPFRGRAAVPLPAHVRRVAIVGDSCVYGAGLTVADTLPERIQGELTAVGWTPEHVALLNFGVPGYSTVQLAVLLDEIIAEHAPDAVVLYPAAWNDQAPALLEPDADMLRRRRAPSWLDALCARSRLAAGLRWAGRRVPHDEIRRAWRRGAPPLGYRVAEADVERNVLAMAVRCRDAALPLMIIAPAHPDGTLQEHERLARDAEAVRRAARAAGAELLDAGPLLAGRGPIAAPDLERSATDEDAGAGWFVDHVHPSSRAWATVAPPVAHWLAGVLGDPPHASTPAQGASPALSIVRLDPPRLSALGDESLTVTLAGWSSRDPLPQVSVGGAPLLGLHPHPVRDGAVIGRSIANAAGTHDVVVQTAQHCAVRLDGLELVQPGFRIIPGSPPRVRWTARLNDRGRLLYSPHRRTVPEMTPQGPRWLDPEGLRTLPRDFVAGADGTSEQPLPAAIADRPDLWLQGLAIPRGEPAKGSRVGRWTAPFENTPPDR